MATKPKKDETKSAQDETKAAKDETVVEPVVDPGPEPLSDDEILEALAPAGKQLRALEQIATTVKAYWEVKSQMQGLQKRRADLKAAVEGETANLEATRKNVTEEIARLNESINVQKEKFEGDFKTVMNQLAAEHSDAKQKLADTLAALEGANTRFADRAAEIDKQVADKEQYSKGVIDGLDYEIKQKNAQLAKVEKDFEDFANKHGMAQPLAPSEKTA